MSKYCPYTNQKTVYLSCQECPHPICEGKTFFCLIVGSRGFSDYSRMKRALDYYLSKQSDIVIVSGDAEGADMLAKQYATEHDYPFICFPADWHLHKKAAGYIRNTQMHDFISKQKKRGCVAFWDGKSKGTAHSFALAEKFKNPIRTVKYE